MRIAFICQNYLPFLGGVETQAQLIAQDLAQRHEVRLAAATFQPCRLPTRLAPLHSSLLAPAHGDFDDGPIRVRAITPGLLQRLAMLPISLRVVPGLQSRAYHGLNRFGFRWFRLAYLKRLESWMQGADVVHSLAGGYLGWTGQAAAIRLGIPFVCTPYVHPKQWGDGPDDAAYYKRADAVIGLLESDRDVLGSLGVHPSKLHVVGVVPLLPDRVDAESFRSRHGLADHPMVLYVGRMMPQKGARAVLQSAELVWQTHPETRFVFIGPPTTSSDTWFAGSDQRILHLGRVSDQEKADALAACTLFCMPSTSEILPAVYLEAWTYKRPVIGGKAHGLPELIDGCGGGVTSTQDAEELAGHIIRLLADPEERARMGDRGAELVEHRFSRQSVVGSLESLYTSLVHARSRRTPGLAPNSLADAARMEA